MTNYVACKFRPEDSRSYTYTWDGDPLAIGDVVKVEDRSGDGWKRVTVASITDQPPPFPASRSSAASSPKRWQTSPKSSPRKRPATSTRH
jgi:hypothetical protein